MYYLPRLNQEEIESIKKPVISNEFEFIIKKKEFPINRSPGQDGLMDEFY